MNVSNRHENAEEMEEDDDNFQTGIYFNSRILVCYL